MRTAICLDAFPRRPFDRSAPSPCACRSWFRRHRIVPEIRRRLAVLGAAEALAHTGPPATPWIWLGVGFDAVGDMGPGLPITRVRPGATVSAEIGRASWRERGG